MAHVYGRTRIATTIRPPLPQRVRRHPTETGQAHVMADLERIGRVLERML